MLTSDLVDAVCEALELESAAVDVAERALLLAWTRATLWQWRSGTITSQRAARLLREFSALHGARVVSRRRSMTHDADGLVVPRPTAAYSPACAPTGW
jgi:hypothetical protein